MFVLENDNEYSVDVDDTLVMWDYPEELESEAMLIGTYDFSQRVLPNKFVIKKIKEHKSRGHAITVWSAGGWEWAKAVVEALDLEKYVDIIKCKPQGFYDDLTSSEFLPEVKRFHIDAVTGEYKNKVND